MEMDLGELLGRQRPETVHDRPCLNPDLDAEILTEALHHYDHGDPFEHGAIIRQKPGGKYHTPGQNHPAIFIRYLPTDQAKLDPYGEDEDCVIGVRVPSSERERGEEGFCFITVCSRRFELYPAEEMRPANAFDPAR
jgi:hypothetical protein